jgi:hypothetical protein
MARTESRSWCRGNTFRFSAGVLMPWKESSGMDEIRPPMGGHHIHLLHFFIRMAFDQAGDGL